MDIGFRLFRLFDFGSFDVFNHELFAYERFVVAVPIGCRASDQGPGMFIVSIAMGCGIIFGQTIPFKESATVQAFHGICAAHMIPWSNHNAIDYCVCKLSITKWPIHAIQAMMTRIFFSL